MKTILKEVLLHVSYVIMATELQTSKVSVSQLISFIVSCIANMYTWSGQLIRIFLRESEWLLTSSINGMMCTSTGKGKEN